MKAVFALVLLLALVAAASAAAPSKDEFDAVLFRRYIATHNKNYAAHEVDMRFQIFKSNLQLVKEHNEKYVRGEVTFKLAMNKFADMTNPEFRNMYNNYRNMEFPVNGCQSEATITYQPTSLPASVDWRTQGVVSGVKDQGQCGSCWAFSAVGSMEGAHAFATKNLVTLSEQQLVDCVNGGKDDCNTGGLMDDAFCYVQGIGMDSEASYPYKGTSGHPCKYSQSSQAATFTSYSDVQSKNETALLYAVLNQPTVSVAIDASSIWFQLYGGGVYNDASCKNGEDDLDHGVLAVGWGTDSTGGDYWIVKNSWGASWGLQGYILMSRNKDNQCGIATDASFPIV